MMNRETGVRNFPPDKPFGKKFILLTQKDGFDDPDIRYRLFPDAPADPLFSDY